MILKLFSLVLIRFVVSQYLWTGLSHESRYKSQWFKTEAKVAKLFLCGVQIWYQQNYYTPKQKCQTICHRQCKRFLRIKRKCRCRDEVKCDPIKKQFRGQKSNRIQFIFCHYQNPNQVKSYMYHGDHSKTSQRTMCPFGKYVAGFRTKFDSQYGNGLTGASIRCINPLDSSSSQDKLVYDSPTGTWHDQISFKDYLINGVRGSKNQIGNLVAFQFEFCSKPFLQSITFKYRIPESIQGNPKTIDQHYITNQGTQESKKTIQVTNQKIQERSFQNYKGQLHEIGLSKMMTRQLSQQYQSGFFIRAKSYNSQFFEIKQSQTTQTFNNFAFGKVQTIKSNKKTTDEIKIPACSRTIIRLFTYQSKVDIPYQAKVLFSNGIDWQQMIIGGKYVGTLYSKTQISIKSHKIICS